MVTPAADCRWVYRSSLCFLAGRLGQVDFSCPECGVRCERGLLGRPRRAFEGQKRHRIPTLLWESYSVLHSIAMTSVSQNMAGETSAFSFRSHGDVGRHLDLGSVSDS